MLLSFWDQGEPRVAHSEHQSTLPRWVSNVINLASQINQSVSCGSVAFGTASARAKYLKHCLLYEWLARGQGRRLRAGVNVPHTC